MKKTLLVAVLLCAVTAFSFAQGTHADVGSTTVGGGISTNWGNLGVAGTGEYTFYKLTIADTVPITFGGAGKVGVYFWPHFSVNVAAMGTAHLGLNAFPELPKAVQNLDFYIDLGPSAIFGGGFGIGLASGGGVSYYINPKTAVNLDSYYCYHFGGWGGASISTLGIMMKL
ncbi:MAG: hypothetical protein LLF89_09080 [Spirochaetaceae bacterium]|nr:hypothetical protein [Spirochaetaceae bacterium]